MRSGTKLMADVLVKTNYLKIDSQSWFWKIFFKNLFEKLYFLMHVYIFVYTCVCMSVHGHVYKSVSLETISCVIFRTTPVPFFRQGLSQVWGSLFRPWNHLLLPDHCWLTAHVTMPGILIQALELKLRSPCSQRMHFIDRTAPTP